MVVKGGNQSTTFLSSEAWMVAFLISATFMTGKIYCFPSLLCFGNRPIAGRGGGVRQVSTDQGSGW